MVNMQSKIEMCHQSNQLLQYSLTMVMSIHLDTEVHVLCAGGKEYRMIQKSIR